MRIVGRKGRGPGEFVRPMEMVAFARDSVLVLDPDANRGTVVASNFRSVRSLAVRHVLFPVLVLEWPSAILANAYVPTQTGIGFPLHWLSIEADRVSATRSFGPDPQQVRRFDFALASQALAKSSTGGFWSADNVRYRLTKWSSDGTKLATLTRNASWFENTSEYGLGTPTEPPPPAITAIAEDGRGLLWVFTRVPATALRDAWPQARRQREVDVRQIALDQLFATIVEVVDPASTRVVTRTRVDQWIVSSLPGDRAAAFVVDADGIGRVLILQLDVRR